MKILFPDFPIRAGPAGITLRERAEKYGIEAMDTAELLEMLLSPDPRRKASVREALAKIRLSEIVCMHAKEIEHLFDLNSREALLLKLTIEVSKRLSSENLESHPMINSASDVAELVMAEMRHLDREHLRVLCLDTKNRLIRVAPVSVGTLNSSLAHPRECFKPAVSSGAASVILVHNHPSGDPTPSSEDIQLTRQLTRASEVVGIDLIDHIVIGQGCFASLRERGLF